MQLYVRKIRKYFKKAFRQHCIREGIPRMEISRLTRTDVKRVKWYPTRTSSYKPRFRTTTLAETLLPEAGRSSFEKFVEAHEPPRIILVACWCVQFPIMAYVLHLILALLVLAPLIGILIGSAAIRKVIIDSKSAGTNETGLGSNVTSALNTSALDLEISDHLTTPGRNVSDHLSSSTLVPPSVSHLPELPLLSSNVSSDLPVTKHFLDISQVSPIFFDLLGITNPNAGLAGHNSSECRETPFRTLHGIKIRNVLCAAENGLRRDDKLLQPDLNEVNVEAVTFAYEMYMTETVAMNIRATSCTSAALENLDLLLSQPWTHLLILNLSVEDSDCLPTILEKVETGLKAPNLQVLCINFLDASDSRHVKTVTSVFESLRPKTLLQLSLIKFVDEGSSGFFLDHEALSSPEGPAEVFQTECIMLKLESEASQDAHNPLFVPHLKDQNMVLMQRSTQCFDLTIDFSITPKVAAEATYQFSINDIYFRKAQYGITVPRFNETVFVSIFPGDIVHIKVQALEKAAPKTKLTIDTATSSLPARQLNIEFEEANIKRFSWDLRPMCNHSTFERNYERNSSVLKCFT